jgi:pimeloyl-ACP methyl ester carboxylesterase
VVEGDPPVAILPPEAARSALFNCSTPQNATWAAEGLGPQPVAPFEQKVTVESSNAEAFRRLPRTYILAEQDRAIPAPMQRRMATEQGCDPVIALDTDHWPWLSRTEEFVNALNTVVKAAR